MGREPLYTGNAPGWSAGGLLARARLRVQERLACVRQPAQERGRLPDVPVPALGLQHAGLDRLEPHLVRPEHRAAPVDRPAVAVDPDHVDVARADRELLLEDLRSLVHHRVEQALEDLLVRDRAALDRLLPGDLEDNLLDVGIGDRRAVAALVAVIAGAGLLAEAPELAEAVRHLGALGPPPLEPPAPVAAGAGAPAIWLRSSVEVLVASTASALQILSSFAKTSFLIAISSKTASITMSASAIAPKSVVPRMSPMRVSTSAAVSRPLLAVAS